MTVLLQLFIILLILVYSVREFGKEKNTHNNQTFEWENLAFINSCDLIYFEKHVNVCNQLSCAEETLESPLGTILFSRKKT